MRRDAADSHERRGATWTVLDMRRVDLGKVLILNGGFTYRMAWHESLPARRLCTG